MSKSIAGALYDRAYEAEGGRFEPVCAAKERIFLQEKRFSFEKTNLS
jgi:hypothetical protein